MTLLIVVVGIVCGVVGCVAVVAVDAMCVSVGGGGVCWRLCFSHPMLV